MSLTVKFELTCDSCKRYHLLDGVQTLREALQQAKELGFVKAGRKIRCHGCAAMHKASVEMTWREAMEEREDGKSCE
jgi:alkylhydroperoxidase family enzyme